MNYIGIDIAKDTHYVAVVDNDENIILRARPFNEDADGYEKLLSLLAPIAQPEDTLVIIEATGHYWKNLFGFLVAKGFPVALINPLRSHNFAKEDLRRAKTDAADALMLARLGRQKRPTPTPPPDELLEELGEAVRLRDRLVQEIGDKARQLHAALDVGFPEFTRHIKDVTSHKATAILALYPSARKMAAIPKISKLSKLVYDGRHTVGRELAEALVADARRSVASRASATHHTQVKYLCEDLRVLRERLGEVDKEIGETVAAHPLGVLLAQLDGVGPQTAARVLAEVGDPARFRSADALASYIGVVPQLRQSGQRQTQRASTAGPGNARLRTALWMPVLTAVKRNPWLAAFYQRLLANGKPPKLAMIAAMRKFITAIYVVARDRKPFVYQVTNSA